MIRRSAAILVLLATFVRVGLAQTPAPKKGPVPGMVILGVPKEPTAPIPFLAGNTQDADASDQLFLRLGIMQGSFNPSGDKALTPMLAEKWERVDSLTLLFTIHPAAKWHDGTPVTARDLVFTWQLAKNPKINSDQPAIEPIESIEALNARTARVRFKRRFAEQLFIVGFGLQILPAHLLEKVNPDSFSTSDFVRHPIGNGPYRFVQLVPGQYLELRADTAFFRGKPTINRVLFKASATAQTRVTQMLAGELDVIDNLLPAQATQVTGRKDYRLAYFPSNIISFVLFNTRSATDSTRPATILSDRRVREALTIGLDRPNLANAVFGKGALVPDAVRSQAWNWVGLVSPAQQELRHARQLLDEAGWRPLGQDSIRQRAGVPLRLTGIYLNVSATRTAFAIQVQQMWRKLGVDLTLVDLPPGTYFPRRSAGTWDVDFTATNQDPSPISLRQSWSCAAIQNPATSNVAHWCDPVFDRLVNEATTSVSPAGAWQKVFDRMASERPAAVLAAPLNQVALHTRYENVIIWPAKPYLSLWQWRVKASAALARDR